MYIEFAKGEKGSLCKIISARPISILQILFNVKVNHFIIGVRQCQQLKSGFAKFIDKKSHEQL